MTRLRSPHGWLILVAGVLAWDLWAGETLSEGARRHPLATFCVAGVTVGHLMGWLPEKVDPYSYMARIRRRRAAIVR